VDIRRNDNVKVITGRDKGKEGRVLRVFPERQQAAGRARDDGEEARAPEPAAQHQGRHRGAGEPDCAFQRATGLPDLRPGADRSRSAGDRKVRVCKKCGYHAWISSSTRNFGDWLIQRGGSGFRKLLNRTGSEMTILTNR
jgi:large subunit ribosomal protein L24